MKKIALIIVLLGHISTSYAQIVYKLSKKGKDEDILSKTLLVGLYVATKKDLAKLKPEEIQEYKDKLEFFNELRKTCIPKYWTVKIPIVFKPIPEIEEMTDESLKPYLRFVESDFVPKDYKGNSNTPTALSYSLLTGKDFDLSFSISNEVNTEMDFKFVLHNLCKYLQGYIDKKPLLDPSLYDKEKNYLRLEKKTLLFDLNMLNQERFTQEKAKEMYPYKIKFSNSDEIYAALEKEDSTALFITYVYNESFGLWCYAIVDVASLDVVAMQPPNRINFRIGAKTSYLGFQSTSNDSKHALTIWRNRPNVQLDDRDFKYLGIKATVDRNYLNPLSGLK